jgi:hypothetical protein
MQLSELDKKIINVMHGLPLEEQQFILEFGLNIKNKFKMKKMRQFKKTSFGTSLKEFLKKYENDPIDIDTSIFDDYRKTVTEREIAFGNDFDEPEPDNFANFIRNSPLMGADVEFERDKSLCREIEL